MEKFNWVVVDKNNKTIAGASDQGKAEVIAKALGGEVKEAAIAILTGELSFNSSTIYFEGADGSSIFNEGLAAAMGVTFPKSNRGAGNTIEIGYVTITIKAATKPDEVTATDYREV
jgi:hypothetical protein